MPFWRSFRWADAQALRYSASFSAYWQPDSLQVFSSGLQPVGQLVQLLGERLHLLHLPVGRGQHGLLATNSMYCGMLANW